MLKELYNDTKTWPMFDRVQFYVGLAMVVGGFCYLVTILID